MLAPPLITLGLSPLVAHLFVMYYACLSAITPPVCVAVFMASGLAKANWFKVGVISCMIALPAFIIPFTFCYNPALLLQGALPEIIIGIASAAIGVCFIDVCIVGYLRTTVSWALRLVMLAGGVMMVIPSYLLSAVGLVVGSSAFLLAWQKKAAAEMR